MHFNGADFGRNGPWKFVRAVILPKGAVSGKPREEVRICGLVEYGVIIRTKLSPTSPCSLELQNIVRGNVRVAVRVGNVI